MDVARPSEPAWVSHAVWWHIYPLGFTGADTSGQDRHLAHRFAQLPSWLDYAVELGVSGIALGPVFASGSHGYDTIDHLRIDPRLGDEEDFDAFVQAAHGRGLRVLLDGVFNHVGEDFAASRSQWIRNTGVDESGKPVYSTFEGHESLLTLDHDNPEVAEYVVHVMRHWLGRGIDGWRLDAAYAIPRPFLSTVLQQVRDSHPHAYVVGEVIHGDYAAIVRETGMDAVTQYELWKAIWSSLNDRNFFELSWAMKRHDEWLGTSVPMTFLGNHDVTRIASKLDDIRHLPHALVLLMTVAGTPSVYYGDEQAFRGIKEERIGGDDEIRPAFPTGPDELAPEGWATYRLYQELIGLRRRNSWLHIARTSSVELRNEQFVYDTSDGERSLRVMLNLGDDSLSVADVEREMLAGRASHSHGLTTVRPHDWAVLG